MRHRIIISEGVSMESDLEVTWASVIGSECSGWGHDFLANKWFRWAALDEQHVSVFAF